MAVVRSERDDGAVRLAGNVSATAISVGGVQAAHVEQETLTVRDTGEDTYARSNAYSKTNSFIRQTRQYVPSKKLRTFLHFRKFRLIMLSLMFFQMGSLAGASGVLATYEPDFVNSIVCLVLSGVALLSLMPLFILFSQHLHVICWTIPSVLRQPILDELDFDNKHLEFAVTAQEAVLVTARERGFQKVTEKTGKVKIQVLGKSGVRRIVTAVATSIYFTVVVYASTIWALVTSPLSIVRFIDVQTQSSGE